VAFYNCGENRLFGRMPMRSRTLLSLVLFALTISFGAAAQSEKQDNGLLARLSYRSDGVVDMRYEGGYPQICFMVYRNGFYRISRLLQGASQNLEGFLSEEQLSEFNRIVSQIDFRSYGDGLRYLGRAESLVAEVVRDGQTNRYAWVDADHRNPFPRSAVNAINWLRQFRARGATPFTYHEMSDLPVCPASIEKLLRPTVAGLTDVEKPHCGVSDSIEN
jgi:hypothetical protein